MFGKPSSFSAFLKAEMERQAKVAHEAHKHVDEMRATLKTEVELARQAGTCQTCMTGAVFDVLADLLIESKPDLLKSETVVRAIPEAAENFATMLMERLLDRQVADRVKKLAAPK
jgi:hypothetical protein